MKIRFCGAAREVTGSCHLIQLENGYNIVLDCGLFQGRHKEMDEVNKKWYFDPADIDCMILSHAHIDHSGRIPKFVKDGFKGTIHSTHATRDLCAVMLLDSAKIQEREAEYANKRLRKRKKNAKTEDFAVPLYTSEDVTPALERFTSYSYERWFRVSKDVEVLFRDAGHILGSASVTIRVKENGETKTIGFTGDIGRPNRPILRDPKPMPEVDYLICESTYGDKEHMGRPDEREKLLDVIKTACVDKKGKLIIPAFSVGRTQEIVHMMDQMATEGLLPRIPVYVDSPLAINATQVFAGHPECYDNEMYEYLLTDDNPFGFANLKYIQKVEESKKLNTNNDPCIIVSSSGMMNAGRVKHHLYNNIEDPKNTLLIVGYCSPQTPGGQLRAGKKEIKLFGDEMKVNMDVKIMDSFSAHADKSEIIQFIDNQKKNLSKLFLVHGNYDSQQAFKYLLYQHDFKDVLIPDLGNEITLSAR